MSSNIENNQNHNNNDTSSQGQQHHPEMQHYQHQPPPPPQSKPGQQEGGQPQQGQQHPPQQQQPPPPNQEMSDSNKRAALAGQWRTPPLPVFPTSATSQHQAPPAPASSSGSHMGLAAPTMLPNNSDDYAKALQEAYRRGAEAAAAMAAHQQHMSPSASCPNFQMPVSAPAPPPPQQQHQQPPQHQQIMASRSEDMTASTGSSTAPPPPYGHPPPPHQHPGYHPQYAHAPPQHHQPPPPHPHAYHPPPQYVAPAPAQPPTQPPPPPPQASAPAPGGQGQSPPQQGSPAVPNPLTNMPPPPKQPPTQRAAPPTPAASGNTNPQIVVPPPQQRSVSLPDMTSYAQQAEEEKRQKRLARNRASARLRRLRKKNLVDAYETEVGILEKTLQQLKAHEWGCPTTGPAAAAAATSEKSHQSLLDALCMDRGQQVISSEQRAQQCQDILEQQLQQMELLRQVQWEQQLLAATSAEHKDADPEIAQMADELSRVLELTDDQKNELQSASRGLDEEMIALDTVFSSLVMMKDNDWLLNQGVQDITDQMTSILHKNQMSKFLLWADANVEAIDQLDHVHAAPKAAPHPQGPIFTFGVETTPMDDEGDGR